MTADDACDITNHQIQHFHRSSSLSSHPQSRPHCLPSVVISPRLDASCSSSMPNTLGSPTTLTSTTTHISPCHLIPLSSLILLSFIFPFSPPNNTLFAFLFCIVRRSKPNTVYALTTRPQSRPLIQRSSPLKIEYRTFLSITSLCGIVAGDAHSLLLSFPYSQLFVAYLFLSHHRRRLNTHRLPC